MVFLGYPLPEFKINGTLNWATGSHRTFLIAEFVDELESDYSAGTRGFFAATADLAGNSRVANDLRDTEIESMTTIDGQYSYSFGERWFMSDTTVAVGVQNIFGEEAPVACCVTGYGPTPHDGRGRLFFLRVGASM